MAHFAKLDDNNIVIECVVVSNNVLLNEIGYEIEDRGIELLKSITGHENWKQTSYSNAFRKNFASIGYTYDFTLDAFIPPKPYNSWLLNETTYTWESPTPMPIDGLLYTWNEDTITWVLSEEQQ
jgi:hypothetical protein